MEIVYTNRYKTLRVWRGDSLKDYSSDIKAQDCTYYVETNGKVLYREDTPIILLKVIYENMILESEKERIKTKLRAEFDL